MVREARFSWHDSQPPNIPEMQESISDLDDMSLDEPAPDRPQRKRRRPPQDSSPQDRSSRHLAGADWIDDRPR